jgi:hypothetical protein
MFVIKVFGRDEEPQIPPPFANRQAAIEWVRGNAWRAPYLADRVELHEIDTATDRRRWHLPRRMPAGLFGPNHGP